MRWLALIALAFIAVPEAGAKEAPKQSVPVPMAALPLIKPTEESKALALELAVLLNSEQLTRRQLKRAYTETLPKVFADNAQFRALEFEYPGVTAVAIKAEEEITVPGTIAILPDLQGALAIAISERMDAAELKYLLDFYRSSAGTKVLDGIAEGSDFSAIAQKNINDDTADLTADDLKGATATASMPIIMNKMTKEDMQQMARFGLSPVGRKWRRMGSILLTTAADYQNRNNGDLRARAEENVAVAVMQYMRDHPSKMRSSK